MRLEQYRNRVVRVRRNSTEFLMFIGGVLRIVQIPVGLPANEWKTVYSIDVDGYPPTPGTDYTFSRLFFTDTHIQDVIEDNWGAVLIVLNP